MKDKVGKLLNSKVVTCTIINLGLDPIVLLSSISVIRLQICVPLCICKGFPSVSSVCCLISQPKHISPVLRNFHWLPVALRIQFKILSWFTKLLMALLHSTYQTCTQFIKPTDLSGHKASISFMFPEYFESNIAFSIYSMCLKNGRA